VDNRYLWSQCFTHAQLFLKCAWKNKTSGNNPSFMTLLHDKGTLDLEAENPSLKKRQKLLFFFLTLRYLLKNHHHCSFLLACTHWLPSCFFPFFLFLENNTPHSWKCESMRERLLWPLTRYVDSWEQKNFSMWSIAKRSFKGEKDYGCGTTSVCTYIKASLPWGCY
jgi:hypothetical protein